MAQNVGARSTWPTGSCTTAGSTPADGAGRHTIGSRIERVGVERALEEQAEVALQLAVVGREDHVGVVAPARAAATVCSTRPHASSMSSFMMCVFALISRMLVVGQRLRDGTWPGRPRMLTNVPSQ